MSGTDWSDWSDEEKNFSSDGETEWSGWSGWSDIEKTSSTVIVRDTPKCEMHQKQIASAEESKPSVPVHDIGISESIEESHTSIDATKGDIIPIESTDMYVNKAIMTEEAAGPEFIATPLNYVPEETISTEKADQTNKTTLVSSDTCSPGHLDPRTETAADTYNLSTEISPSKSDDSSETQILPKTESVTMNDRDMINNKESDQIYCEKAAETCDSKDCTNVNSSELTVCLEKNIANTCQGEKNLKLKDGERNIVDIKTNDLSELGVMSNDCIATVSNDAKGLASEVTYSKTLALKHRKKQKLSNNKPPKRVTTVSCKHKGFLLGKKKKTSSTLMSKVKKGPVKKQNVTETNCKPTKSTATIFRKHNVGTLGETKSKPSSLKSKVSSESNNKPTKSKTLTLKQRKKQKLSNNKPPKRATTVSCNHKGSLLGEKKNTSPTLMSKVKKGPVKKQNVTETNCKPTKRTATIFRKHNVGTLEETRSKLSSLKSKVSSESNNKSTKSTVTVSHKQKAGSLRERKNKTPFLKSETCERNQFSRLHPKKVSGTSVLSAKLRKSRDKRKELKRKTADSSSSEDDIPLSILADPEKNKEDTDSDVSYKPDSKNVNSSDSEYSQSISEKEKNSLNKNKKLKEQGNKTETTLQTQAKESDNVKQNAYKRCTQSNNNREWAAANSTFTEKQKKESLNQRHIDDSTLTPRKTYAALIEKAKEETRIEQEQRKLIETLHENRIDQLLFSNGFIRQCILPDGNCFFEATILALQNTIDAKMLRTRLCQHLEENMEEYIGFLLNKSKPDDISFLKEYLKEIDVLKQDGYWSNRAGDFLPLALSNWSRRPVRIYTSKQEQPVIEVQPTLGPAVMVEPICLAYISAPGVSEHYDACRKSTARATKHDIEELRHIENDTEPPLVVNETQNVEENQPAIIAHEICISEFTEDSGVLDVDEMTETEKSKDTDGTILFEESTSSQIADVHMSNSRENTDQPNTTTLITSNVQYPLTPRKKHASATARSPRNITPRKAAKYITPVKRKLVRKRTATPEQWKKNIRKKLRLSGKEYQSTTGKIMHGKTMRPPCNNCRYKCNTKISEENRLQMFNSFWSLGSYERQKDFVCASISEKKTRTYLDENDAVKEKKRMVTRIFTFENEGEKITVCKKFFAATLSIGEGYIKHAMNRKSSGRFHGTENRGRHTPHNKTETAKLIKVREHIESFPKVQGHYIRKESNRQFLGSELTLPRMYKLYKENCHRNSDEPVRIARYRKVFNEEYNYSFHVPKKDQCNTCTRYYQAIEEGNITEELKDVYEKHQNRKVRARQEKLNDKATANSSTSTFVATFDLQSVLYTPCTLVSLMYYMRKLCCYNFTVYNLSSQAGTCYVWSEVEAGRGSCEVATCLRLQLLSLPLNIDHVILYSDACGGQNRNQIIATSLLDAVSSIDNIKTIDHKFLESGHTHMECDSMHAAIEFAKKRTSIYVPSQWDTVLCMARRTNPYTVIPVKHEDIVDFKQIKSQRVKNVRITTEGKKVNWTKIRWMRFQKDSPDTCFVKYEFDDEFQSIKVIGSKRARNTDTTVPVEILPRRYKTKIPISAAKKKDLVGICKSGIIPSEFHDFYKSLPSHQSVNDRLPLPDILEADSDSDTDVE